MKNKIALSIAIFSLVLAGCAKEQIYSSSPPMKAVSNDLYEAKLEPLKAEGYNYDNSFRFVFTNKSNTPEVGFSLGVITPGENGMSLVVRQGGKFDDVCTLTSAEQLCVSSSKRLSEDLRT